MLRYVIKFISPLVFLISFWWFFYQEAGIWYILAVSVVNILFSFKVIAKRFFWQHKLIWINFILVYLSQIFFLILSTSDNFRYYFSFLISVVWGVVWFLLEKYFDNIKLVNHKEYLSFNRFFYYSGMWFLSTSVYSIIIVIKDISFKYGLFAIILAGLLWSWDIFRNQENARTYYIWLTTFLFAQIVIAVYLLPVDFYVAGTIVSLWFFFIIDKIIGQIKYLRFYMILFFISILLLFVSSII